VITTEQVQQALKVTATLAEAIRTLGEVPSGHLYARVMGSVNYENYTAAIRTLKNAGLVEERSHLLRWVGPTFDAEGRKI